MLLDVQGLVVRYGKRTAIDGVSLSVDAGEILGLLGPNGAGKSTALLAIAGVIAPAAGSVRIGGQEAQTARARVGLADQPPTLYEFFTVEEHLTFVAETRGRAANDPATHRVIDELGLGPVGKRLCRELSFGYRQRVGLAAALVGDTRVVLLDETLNGLDPRAAKLARETLVRTAGGGAAVIMSTHLLGVAERLCTRLAIVDQGKIVAEVDEKGLEELRKGGEAAIEELYLQKTSEGEPA